MGGWVRGGQNLTVRAALVGGWLLRSPIQTVAFAHTRRARCRASPTAWVGRSRGTLSCGHGGVGNRKKRGRRGKDQEGEGAKER